MTQSKAKSLNSFTPNDKKINKLFRRVHNQAVVLDVDLAKVYNLKITELNALADQNSDRFPNDFRFKLTAQEAEELGLKKNQTNTYVYSEAGIYMLAMIIKNPAAVKVSLAIIRAFADTGGFAARIFFSGQVYEAYSFLSSLIKRAKKSIILIDGYVNINTLDLLRNKREGISISILTLPSSKLSKNEIRKFNSEYPCLSVYKTSDFHDRLLILDEKEFYHVGASLKDAGGKSFAITKLEEIDETNLLLSRINAIKSQASQKSVA